VHEWSAEHIVDEGLARRLITAQCFEPETLQLLGEGWDNTVWLIDDRWAFRFPRRRIAIPGFKRELAALGEIAAQVPLPTPVPVWVGEPSPDFRWPFYGGRLVRGVELPDAQLSDEERCALGRPLGRFLRRLHDAVVTAELPLDPMQRGNMATRVPRTFEALLQIDHLWPLPDAVRDALLSAERIAPGVSDHPRVLHGDLHLRHLLIHEGALAGVIDWGDVCRGDPSIDLAVCWFALPPDGRAGFFAEYGRVSEAQLLRARVLSLFMCATLVVYGVDEGLDNVVREALAGLERSM
jgi:aminoglycoside phosphotransferase (APT) family kinase protein